MHSQPSLARETAARALFAAVLVQTVANNVHASQREGFIADVLLAATLQSTPTP
ncbi:hypothetical protein [Rhodococcoides fascians]|uniref:hypothetical protein n=1 Tax=Rhodococcoides fascians TaxID=1828 RepID=UPI001482B581|nr:MULTISPECIES: hypothetical protein [Rhodococcus]